MGILGRESRSSESQDMPSVRAGVKFSHMKRNFSSSGWNRIARRYFIRADSREREESGSCKELAQTCLCFAHADVWQAREQYRLDWHAP